MTVVTRYLAREITAGVFLMLAAFLGLFAFFDLVNEFDDLGDGGYRIQHALAYVGLNLPGRIYELMPIAALIGAVYALARFAAQSEFTAMRAAGMGRTVALRGVLVPAAGFVVFTALMGEVVAPPAERLAREVRLLAKGGALTGMLRSGAWIKDTVRDAEGQAVGVRFLSVGALLPEGGLSRLQVHEFDAAFALRSVLRARSARYLGEGVWMLEQLEETRFETLQAPDGGPGLQSRFLKEAERRWVTGIDPDLLRVSMVDPSRMSVLALAQFTRHLDENRQSADRYRIALWKKIVYPLAVVVMMVLALPFAYLQVRAGTMGYKVFMGILIGIVFHFLNGLFSHLGLLNTWPAWLAVSIPSLVALTLAMGMLSVVGRMR